MSYFTSSAFKGFMTSLNSTFFLQYSTLVGHFMGLGQALQLHAKDREASGMQVQQIRAEAGNQGGGDI